MGCVGRGYAEEYNADGLTIPQQVAVVFHFFSRPGAIELQRYGLQIIL